MAKRHKSVFTPCRSRVSAPGPARMCAVGLSRWLPRQNQEAGQLQARTGRSLTLGEGWDPLPGCTQPQVGGKYLWPPGESRRLGVLVLPEGARDSGCPWLPKAKVFVDVHLPPWYPLLTPSQTPSYRSLDWQPGMAVLLSPYLRGRSFKIGAGLGYMMSCRLALVIDTLKNKQTSNKTNFPFCRLCAMKGGTPRSSGAIRATVTVTTASTQEAEGMPEACTTTGTNTIQVTLGRLK